MINPYLFVNIVGDYNGEGVNDDAEVRGSRTISP